MTRFDCDACALLASADCLDCAVTYLAYGDPVPAEVRVRFRPAADLDDDR
jgi:hypothetical protein